MPIQWHLVSAETLAAMDFDRLLEDVEQRECADYGDKLSRLDGDETRWSPEQRECLRFVGQAVTMLLRSDEPGEPFGPMVVLGEQRSAKPTDFPREQLLGLQEWAISLRDPELRARLLDLVWLQTRSFPAALGAVEAYLASAKRLEHPKNWPPSVERLERALRLAVTLGKGGLDLRDRVLGEIQAMLQRNRGNDPLYLSLRLTRLLLEFKHGDAHQFATFAATAANRAESDIEFRRAGEYFQLEAECHRLLGDSNAEGAARRQSAESLVRESELAYGQPGRGALAAAAILSDAVEAMRQAPGGKQRASELHERLLELQRESVTELKQVSTDIDAAECTQRALTAVRGKPLSEAVLALCLLARPPSIEQLKKQVHEQARVAVLGSLFSCDVLNSRGMVVARAPGLEVGADDPKQDGLRWRMFTNASFARGLTVQAILNPAREEVFYAHCPSRNALADLIRYSPWIPPDHVESILRALSAGFHGDMLVAGHLVPLQLEALVRHVVESNGASITTLEPGGVQSVRPLGPLLETPEARRAFGADGIFELQGLLTDPLGSNLRNEVAHALVGDSGLFSADLIYCWWLLLRFCVVTSKLAERRLADSAAETTGPGRARPSVPTADGGGVA